MKDLKKLIIGILIALLIMLIYQGCESAADEKFENAIGDLKSYQFGDSRVPLSEIENLVVLITDEEEKKIKASRLAELLDADVSFAAKQFVCQQLRLIGNEEQIPILEKLLLDEECGDIAVFALEQMPSPKVDEIFRNTINELNGKAKIGVINAMGERRDKGSVQVLSPFLTSSERYIAEAAALALSKIGTSDAGYEIKKVKDNVSGKWHEKLANYYLMCASNMVDNGDKESATKIYSEMSFKGENDRLKMIAQSGLVTTGHLGAEVFVLKAIKAEDPVIRRLAMNIVVHTPGEDATLKFCAILPDLPESSQALLLLALSDRGDPLALETVRRELNHVNRAIRISALKAIATLGDETMVPILMQIIIKSSGPEGETARESLNRLNGNQVDNEILLMTGDDNVAIRKEAIKALAVRNYVKAKPTLLKMLRDPQEDVRVSCWMALGELSSDSDLSPMITSWLKVINKRELNIAEDAVVKVSRKMTIQKGHTSEIITALTTQKNKDIKISLISSLGRIGDEDALPQLRELLNNNDSEIRTATIRAMSSWPTEEPLEDLRDLITTTDDEIQKVIALRGFIRLIGLETERSSEKTISLYDDAMKLAWRDEEKKLVLAGYSGINSFSALKMIEEYLSDDELKNEAAAASIKVCEDLIEETPGPEEKEKIISIMDKIILNIELASVKIAAVNIKERLEE